MNKKELKQIIAEEIKNDLTELIGPEAVKSPQKSPTSDFDTEIASNAYKAFLGMTKRIGMSFRNKDDFQEILDDYIKKTMAGVMKKAMQGVPKGGVTVTEAIALKNRAAMAVKAVVKDMEKNLPFFFPGVRRSYAKKLAPFVKKAFETGYKKATKIEKEDDDIKNEVSYIIKRNKAIIKKFGHKPYIPSSEKELNQLFGINSDTLNQQTVASIIAFQEKAFPGQTDEHDGLFGGKTGRAFKKMKKQPGPITPGPTPKPDPTKTKSVLEQVPKGVNLVGKNMQVSIGGKPTTLGFARNGMTIDGKSFGFFTNSIMGEVQLKVNSVIVQSSGNSVSMKMSYAGQGGQKSFSERELVSFIKKLKTVGTVNTKAAGKKVTVKPA